MIIMSRDQVTHLLQTVTSIVEIGKVRIYLPYTRCNDLSRSGVLLC